MTSFTVATLGEFLRDHVNNTNITSSLSTVFSNTDPSVVIEFMKLRYGNRLLEKSGNGWRCFFCNKEFRNNFARHALRHAMKGDKVNETLKELILEGAQLPPPTWSEYMSKKKLQRELEQNEGYWSTNKIQTYTPPTRSSTNQLRNNELAPQQLLFLVTQRIPSYLLQSPIITVFLQEAEKSSNSLPNLSGSQYPAFLASIRQVGEKILTERGSLSYEFEDLKRVFKYIEGVYREEAAKRNVFSSIEASKLLSTCAICSNSPNTSHGSLVPCIGHCFRAFHISCVSSSSSSVLYSQSTGKRSVYCDDCKNGRKVLRWDANRKQYYYFHIDSEASAKNFVPNGEIVPGGLESEEAIRLAKGTARDLTLLFDPSALSAPSLPLKLTDASVQLPHPLSASSKQSLRSEEANHRSDMWYDPYLCVWRCKTKEAIAARHDRQHKLLATLKHEHAKGKEKTKGLGEKEKGVGKEKEKGVEKGLEKEKGLEEKGGEQPPADPLPFDVLPKDIPPHPDGVDTDIDVSHFLNDDDDDDDDDGDGVSDGVSDEDGDDGDEDEEMEEGETVDCLDAKSRDQNEGKKRLKKRKSTKPNKKRKMARDDESVQSE